MVIGYGPTGRTVVRLLRENDVVPTVVELNVDTLHALKEQGIDAVYERLPGPRRSPAPDSMPRAR